MNDAQFNRLFDAAFEVSAKQIHDEDFVDHRPSWMRVQQKLNSQRTRKGIRSKLSKLAVVAASLLIGAVIFGNTQAARAIEPLYATLKEYPSGFMSFFYGRAKDTDTSNAKTQQPPDFAQGLNIEKVNDFTYTAIVTEIQASKLLSIRVPVFRFIPTGYSFNQAQVYFYNGKEKSDHIIYQFLNDKQKIMNVSLQKMKPNSGLGTNTVEEGVTVKKIQLSNAPAVLTTATNGSSSLETIAGGLHVNMSGIVPSDELIRMYEEMYE
ncbi:DUF4367 domain-containing protein [Cohnella silvisoli]|uniref:DUF4367 domain-containing protein n=1 Tax=Cohnella silvisoli TaxID=2873699 RepID=A0ABV1KKU6_9BACL|nr:DUF4367 domain-containing protein [Cohnella silvisoli]MCD9020883.1 DUF4367 domain-containing protein [Cohnella silvisoli]